MCVCVCVCVCVRVSVCVCVCVCVCVSLLNDHTHHLTDVISVSESAGTTDEECRPSS